MAVFSLGGGGEVRLVFVRRRPDGTVSVRQVTEGPDTSLCYGSRRHGETLVFTPTEDYDLADVTDDIERRGNDFYLDDVADSLELWGVPFTRIADED